MAKKSSNADFLTDWGKLLFSVNANAGELPDLVQVYRASLEEVFAAVTERGARQVGHRSAKQLETKELKTLMRKGRIKATGIRRVLLAHFGPDSEKLVEYGIRPVRPRSRPTKPEGPEPPKPVTPAAASEVKPAAQTTEAPKPEGPAPAPEVKPASQGS
jgi:hypothetical protein